jgi:hypothetical protein
MTRNKPSPKRTVRIIDKRGRVSHRLVRRDTLRSYQRVGRGKKAYYGRKVPLLTKQGVRHRYVSPDRLLKEYEFESGAYQKRREILEPPPGKISVRLVVVYGVVKGEDGNYVVVGEWYWYLDSDRDEKDLVPEVLAAIEDRFEGRKMFRIGGRDRVRIGFQRFEAKKGPLVVDEATLFRQLKERLRGLSDP